MKSKKQNQNSTPVSSWGSLWEISFGVAVCFFALLVPFFPDEKLVRVKLEVCEWGIFILVGMIGLRAALANEWPHFSEEGLSQPIFKSSLWLSVLVLVWFLFNGGLWFTSEEKPLANAEIRRVFLGFGAFIVFRFGCWNRFWIKRFLFSFMMGAFLVSLYGILQRNGGIGPIAVPQMQRVFGTFGNPIFFAAYLVVAFFVTLAAFQEAEKQFLKWVCVVALLSEFTALVLTQTRAAWVAWGVSVILLILTRFRWTLKSILAAGFILAGAFSFIVKTQDIWKRDQGHLMIWRDTLKMWKDHPIKGVGLGAFHTQFPDYAGADLKSKWPQGQFIVNYAHNEYLQILAEGGILIFVVFSLMLFFFFKLLWKKEREREPRINSPPYLFLGLGALALLVQNLFSVDMRFNISFAYFFMLMGLASQDISPAKFSGLNIKNLEVTWPVRIIFAGLWIFFMAVLLAPKLLEPYRAHKIFSQKVDFFDERLLDPAKSIQDLEILAAQYPEEVKILERLAYVYAKEMKFKDGKINISMANKAIKMYNKIIEINPGNEGAYNNYGNILYTLGRTDPAIQQWEKAVKVKPDFLDVHLNLGKIYYTRGELKKAARHLDTVLKLDNGNAEALIYMKRMVE